LDLLSVAPTSPQDTQVFQVSLLRMARLGSLALDLALACNIPKGLRPSYHCARIAASLRSQGSATKTSTDLQSPTACGEDGAFEYDGKAMIGFEFMDRQEQARAGDANRANVEAC
jgi:hypothetical protein